MPGAGAGAAENHLFRQAASTLTATSLAIVGASERARWPSEIFHNLRAFGYPGRIALINPRQTQVFGERCYPSLRDLPEPVDHALVIVPAPAVPTVLTDAEAAGVKTATVYARDRRRRRSGIVAARRRLRRLRGDEPAAGRRTQLHGRQFVPRETVRLSQHRPVRAEARLGRLPVPVRRHHPVLDAGRPPTAGCASPMRDLAATSPTSISPTM